MNRYVLTLLLLTVTATATAQAKVDFASQIWPIFQKRCLECHSAAHTDDNGKLKKPKGRVELDSAAGIKKSKRGKLVVAGKSADSKLYEAITLPEDHDDVMPPAKKGKPLGKKETDLIQKWIDDGADFGTWKGSEAKGSEAKDSKEGGDGDGDKPGTSADKGKPATSAKNTGSKSGARTKNKAAALVSLAKGVKPISAEVLAGFAKGQFKVSSVGDDSPLLQVTSFGKTDSIDDAAVATLLPIAANIAELSLAATRVTDAVGATLAKMPRLVALDLRQTEIANHGTAALAACTELRSLNLYGTKVSDYGASALAKLKNLEVVYLWQTEVAAKTVLSLQQAIPGLEVVMAAELPEPMENGGNNGRPRRGKK